MHDMMHMHGAVLARSLPHRDVGEEEIILHPRMGDHCVVTRNGPTDLSTKMVEDCLAWRVLGDELESFIAGSDRRPVAATRRKIARWSGSAARSPRTGRYRASLSAVRICSTQEVPAAGRKGMP